MATLSDQELIGYLLGEATPESAAAIRARAADDRELAATLELLSCCEPVTMVEMSRRRRWSAVGVKRIVLALVACLTVVSVSWAGWVLLAPKPLLEDHFQSNWGDTTKWKTPRRSVKVEGGHLRLFDRGYLVTLEQYPGPIDLSFRWRWTDLAENFAYQDELTVALRTSGIPRDVHAHEATDGILVKLNATSGNVKIISADDLQKRIAETDESSLPLSAEQWRRVRITDDGETVSVYLDDSPRGMVIGGAPVISVRVPQTPNKHHIAFYNRERLASVSHESWIDDVILRPLVAARRP